MTTQHDFEDRLLTVIKNGDNNPVVRILAEASLAMVRLRIDIKEADDNDDLSRIAMIYKIRVERAMKSLRAIDDDTWRMWCEDDKDKMISRFEIAYDLDI